ncbi:Ig-like domain-containing domain [Algoriphagus aquatilis]|uniref:Ig-like domain-containing domain n=1 Tax=Algoriphagus aquatilis TaxID=490186 RepID=A0ABW0BX61_9BACT
MKSIKALLFLIFIQAVLVSCAKQSSPTGGPRDEDPPKLIESNPKDQSLNTKPEQIKLTFDEFVALENANKGVVITPRIDKDKIEFTALKNTVLVNLNQDLEDSTTYVFDFQKAVVDLSEKNPAENLKIVFSTGTSIDSLNISGNINFYYPENKEDYKNVLVGVYPLTDTTDVFTAQPYYLGQVDTLGNFNISNVKNGSYKAYAWRDLNGNLKGESKSEDYDFMLDTIFLESDISGIQFNLSKADLTPIRIIRSAATGKNFDIVLNRNPIESSVKNQDVGKNYFFSTSDKRIRIYSKTAVKDSIAFNISVLDSVGFKKDTLIWGKFPESERKPEKLETSINSGKNFYQNLEIELKFNKPIQAVNFDSLYIQYDTASIIKINEKMVNFSDSSRMDLLKINLIIPDSITKEILTLRAADSTFIDIEGQYNDKKIEANYRKLKRENLADEIKGQILNARPPFIVQLIDNKDEVLREIYVDKGNHYSFKLVEPGTFKIRVIEDLNGNKRWDPSNFIQKRHAERVFYFKGEEEKSEIILRGGWTLEDQDINASRKTGKN